jgi:hypothetical protein
LLAGVALGVALLPVGVGMVGRALGRVKANAALSSGGFDPEQRERVRVEGYSEANACVVVGGTLTALPFSLAVIALATAYALRRKQSEA